VSLTCRSCEAPITFARTAKGHRMPIEPAKNGNGNLKLQPSLDPKEPPLAVNVAPGTGTHVSHFATCPHAPQHRKER
jgi:hypothetical protein